MNQTRLLTMRHVVTDHAISRYIFEHGNNYQNVLLHSMKTLGRYFFLARLVLYITYIVSSNSSSIQYIHIYVDFLLHQIEKASCLQLKVIFLLYLGLCFIAKQRNCKQYFSLLYTVQQFSFDWACGTTCWVKAARILLFHRSIELPSMHVGN